MKDNSHNPTESVEKQHYKKSYLMRLLEEKEATEEIERCIAFEQEDYVEQTRTNRKPD